MANKAKSSPARDALRSRLLGNMDAKFKTKEITLYGEKVVIRQPPLSAVLDAQQNADQKSAMVEMMVNYIYVPGTNEQVFEIGDMEAILSMPFSADMALLQKTITDLTSINVAAEVKNSASERTAA
jgi:hypothetical protein